VPVLATTVDEAAVAVSADEVVEVPLPAAVVLGLAGFPAARR